MEFLHSPKSKDYRLEDTLCFEHDEELINFLYHFHRLQYFKKNNPLCVFTQKGKDIYITIPYNKNGELKLVKDKYYWDIPTIQEIGLKNNDTINYRNKEEKRDTSLEPTINPNGDMSLELKIETIVYNQMYKIDFSRTTETKMPDNSIHSLKDKLVTDILMKELLL